MQELAFIISIMLGVVVLTAWVMWILLRPSGDSKTQQFASESARDGLTLTVIENNDLKNKITQLERELKALMSAGFGKGDNTSEKLKVESDELQVEREKGKGERENLSEKLKDENVSEKLKDESLKVKDEGPGTKDERENPSEKDKDEGTEVEKREERIERLVEELKVKGELKKEKMEARREKENVSEKLKVESGELQEERSGTKDTGLRIKDEGLTARIKDEGLKIKDEYLSAEAEVAVPKPVEFIQSVDVPPLSEAQRVADGVEKKKIADYLASVADATERQMKEVEALDDNYELTEEMQEYPDDDLKKIKGIGPHLEGQLKKAGISSHQQIAEFTEEDIQRVSRQIGFFPRRINRDAWVVQAKALINKG